MRVSRLLISATAMALFLAASIKSEASSINHVDLAGGGIYSTGYAISSDGSTFVGTGDSGPSEAFRWTAGSGASGLGFLLLGSQYSEAYAVSADGSVVVGGSQSAAGYQAYRWTSGAGIVGIGELAGGSYYSEAFGVSADGTIVVGFSEGANGYEAFRWTLGTGMVGIGDLAGGSFNSSARGISADGTIIVGNSYSANGIEAFRWTSGTGMVGLGDLAGGGFNSDARGISGDGTTIVGSGESANGTEAFRWTSGTGMVGLGDLVGGVFESRAWAVNADGTVVVGYSEAASGREAFRWTQGVGMESLATLLTTAGVDLTGYVLSSANGVDASGDIIVGNATYLGDNVAFIANLATGGVTTPADLSAGLTSGITPVEQVQSAASNNLGQSLFAATQSSSLFNHSGFSVSGAPAAGDGYGESGSWWLRDERRWAAYAVGLFGIGQNNDADNTSLNGTTGLMAQINDQWVVGLGVIGSHNGSDMAFDGESKLKALGGSLVTSYEGESGLRLYGSAFAAYLDIHTERKYLNGASTDTSRGSTDGMGYGGAARAGWEFAVDDARVMPYGEVQISKTKLDSYTETGGAFPATFGSSNTHQTTTRLGTQVSYDVTPTLTLASRLAWAHRLNESNDGISASSTGFTGTVGLPSGDRNWGELSVQAGWQITPDTHLSTELTGRSGRTQDPAGTMTVGLSTRF